MARCYVSVGSNIAREQAVRAGVAALREAFGAVQVSSIYESGAVGFSGDPFFNLVVGFDTELDVHTVARRLRGIEDAHGRDRNACCGRWLKYTRRVCTHSRAVPMRRCGRILTRPPWTSIPFPFSGRAQYRPKSADSNGYTPC
jgi:hypothetical protein